MTGEKPEVYGKNRGQQDGIGAAGRTSALTLPPDNDVRR
jgi:hypothetical protein